jgi:lysozyme
MSIIGESFRQFVSTQIFQRQTLYGKKTRSAEDLTLLTNNNAWLKLASSVRVIPLTEKETEEGANESKPVFNIDKGIYEDNNISSGEQRLRDIGLTDTGKFTGNQLARKAVLFNTLTQVNPTKRSNNPSKKDTPGSKVFRKGVISTSTSNLWNNNSYGLGSKEQGIVPAPGLISAKINCKNRGSIREATVVMKAYNLFQFELIELLYMRLGYTMMLEWGVDKFKNNKGELQLTGNTIIEDIWFNDFPKYSYQKILSDIEVYRKRYEANYDGFLGKVVNFNWSFQPDGTYDITLKLITVGDVIESLKVNLPSVTTDASISTLEINQSETTKKLKKINSVIINNAGSSTLSIDLFRDIAQKEKEQWTENQSNYFGLFTNLEKDDDYNLLANYQIEDLASSGSLLYLPTGTDAFKFNYYLTFQELLTKLNTLCLPSINNNKMLEFSITEEEEICSVFPNQVSFDPKICLIKPQFSDEINLDSKEKFKNTSLGIKNFYNAFSKLKPFLPEDECSDPKVLYGNIMNIYLNYDFVSTVLEKNTKDGDLSIFKFLQAICNGINNALGGFNKLEPILENDYIIKIIDQNPIPGIENSNKFSNRFNANVPFEVYGYSNGPSGSSISNFVRDFSFKTKIGPELASMITIGATAANKSTKNYDGTAFSKWNDGLEDAYALEYKDPDKTTPFKKVDTWPLNKKQLEAIIQKWEDSEFDFSILPDDYAFALISMGGYNPLGAKFAESTLRGDMNKETTAYEVTNRGVKDIDGCPVTGEDYSNVSWAEYVSKVKNWVENDKDPEEEDQGEAKSYISWLIQAFGGKLDTAQDSKLYFYFNNDFYKIGKSLFKGFINQVNNVNYAETKNPSNTIGFIPADLGLTINGLSGIRIYNALTINQKFLPKAYPKALKFLITKVDHEISNNDWLTSLGTLSVPNTIPIQADIYKNLDIVVKNQIIDSYLDIDDISYLDVIDYNNRNRIPINELTASDAAIEELIKSEGFRKYSYDDKNPGTSRNPIRLTQDTIITPNTTSNISATGGTLTIGYGFTRAVIPSLSWNTEITENESKVLLKEKLKSYEDILKKNITVPLRQPEFDALLNIVYNAGSIGNTSNNLPTPLQEFINNGQYREAAEVIPKYRTTQNGVPNASLVIRRRREKELYLS